MITVWELNSQKKEVRPLSIDQWQIGGTLSWVDCFLPTSSDFEILSLKTGIPIEDLRDSVDENKRPHIVPHDHHSLIIFRAPYEGNGKILNAPVGIFFFKHDIITIHRKKIKSLDKFRSFPASQLLLQ